MMHLAGQLYTVIQLFTTVRQGSLVSVKVEFFLKKKKLFQDFEFS